MTDGIGRGEDLLEGVEEWVADVVVRGLLKTGLEQVCWLQKDGRESTRAEAG